MYMYQHTIVGSKICSPDPNGRINIQNWRFMSLVCGVVVPRNKVILNYLQIHLRRCSLDPYSDEGKFAQFAMQVSPAMQKVPSLILLHLTCKLYSYFISLTPFPPSSSLPLLPFSLLPMYAVYEQDNQCKEQEIPSVLQRGPVHHQKVKQLLDYGFNVPDRNIITILLHMYYTTGGRYTSVSTSWTVSSEPLSLMQRHQHKRYLEVQPRTRQENNLQQ